MPVVRDDLEATIAGRLASADSDMSLFGQPSAAAPAEPVRIRALLQRTAGQDREDDIPIEGEPVKLGRAPSPDGRSRLVKLDDPFVSKDHAILETGAEGLIVQDLNSSNGTFVNGQRVKHAVLRAGDQLRVGQTDLWVVFP